MASNNCACRIPKPDMQPPIISLRIIYSLFTQSSFILF